MTASNTYGRQVVVPLTNKSGGGVIAGDVVVVDTTNNDAFTTSTAGAFLGMVGIAQETIASLAVGRVLTAGYAALVLTSASVTRGNFGKTHTVAKQAVDAGASRVVGVFCQFLTGGTTPDAVLFGLADASSATGNVATDAIWDVAGDLAVGTGANTAARLPVGAAGTFLQSSGTTAQWASIAGKTLQRVTRTAGNISLTGSTTTMTEVSSAFRLTLAAAIGDVLQIGCSILVTQGGTGEAIIDSATIVSGAIVNQVSPGTNHVGHLYTNAALRSGGATLTYVAVSGDISGGNIIMTMTFINTDAAAGTLRAASDYALTYWAMNMGH